MTANTSLVWFRHDLRVADNPALTVAVKRGGPIIPVYIWEPQEEGAWSPRAASHWWLHQSLTSLDTRLRKCGSRLVMRQENSLSTLQSLIQDTDAQAVFWNHRYEPSLVERDTAITRTLCAGGLYVESFHAGLLFDPRTVLNVPVRR